MKSSVAEAIKEKEEIIQALRSQCRSVTTAARMFGISVSIVEYKGRKYRIVYEGGGMGRGHDQERTAGK
jgi:transcriptional regulator with GAF, ATPase, and Fis domain